MFTTDEIFNISNDIFKSLCSKYNINKCYFRLCDWNEYLQLAYEEFSDFKRCKSKHQLIDLIDSLSYSYQESFMLTHWNIVNNKEVVHYIIFPIENIYKLYYELLAERNDSPYNITINDEDIINIITVVMTHEIGHVLHDNQIFKKYGLEEGKHIMCDSKYKDEFYKYLDYMLWAQEHSKNQIDYIKKTCKKYYAMYFEKSANKMVNLKVNDIIDVEIKRKLGKYVYK